MAIIFTHDVVIAFGNISFCGNTGTNHEFVFQKFWGKLNIKISVKDLAVNMDLGNNGITLDVYDNNDSHLGDLRIGKGTIEWCKGKKHAGNGVQVRWLDLIEWFENEK